LTCDMSQLFVPLFKDYLEGILATRISYPFLGNTKFAVLNWIREACHSALITSWLSSRKSRMQ